MNKTEFHLNASEISHLFEDVIEAYNLLDNKYLNTIEDTALRTQRLGQRQSMFKEWKAKLARIFESTGDVPADVPRVTETVPGVTETPDWLISMINSAGQVLTLKAFAVGAAVLDLAEDPAGPGDPAEPEAAEPVDETPVKKKKGKTEEKEEKAAEALLESLPEGNLCVVTLSIKSTAKKKDQIKEIEGLLDGQGASGGVGKASGGILGLTFYFDDLEKARGFYAKTLSLEYVKGYTEAALDAARHEIDDPWCKRLENWISHLSACGNTELLQSTLGITPDGKVYDLPRSLLKKVYNEYVNVEVNGTIELLLVVKPQHQTKKEWVATLTKILGMPPKRVVPSPEPNPPGYDIVFLYETVEAAEAAYKLVEDPQTYDFITGFSIDKAV